MGLIIITPLLADLAQGVSAGSMRRWRTKQAPGVTHV